MTITLSRPASGIFSVLIASAVAIIPVSAQTGSIAASDKAKEGLKVINAAECATGMEASALFETGLVGLVYYTCSFSTGFGCIKGQTCPAPKCKPDSYTGDWKKLGALDDPTPPDGTVVQTYACAIKGTQSSARR